MKKLLKELQSDNLNELAILEIIDNTSIIEGIDELNNKEWELVEYYTRMHTATMLGEVSIREFKELNRSPRLKRYTIGVNGGQKNIETDKGTGWIKVKYSPSFISEGWED